MRRLRPRARAAGMTLSMNDTAPSPDRVAPLRDLQATIAISAPNGAEIADQLRQLAPQVRTRLLSEPVDVSDAELLITWYLDDALRAAMPALRLVQANGAGVDGILRGLQGPNGPEAPVVCRTVDPHLVEGMSAYVSWAVLDHLKEMPHYRAAQAARSWAQRGARHPAGNRVGIAGAGELGLASAQALAALGFPTRTWSRSDRPSTDPRVQHFAGHAALGAFLEGLDCLVCLLPLTPDTRGFLGAPVFGALARGAHVINVGRGEHLMETQLLEALDSGRLGRATLDVATVEPLPADHAFWTHPGVMLTPHIAARAAAPSVAGQALANLLALREGRPLTHRVDPAQGY